MWYKHQILTIDERWKIYKKRKTRIDLLKFVNLMIIFRILSLYLKNNNYLLKIFVL